MQLSPIIKQNYIYEDIRGRLNSEGIVGMIILESILGKWSGKVWTRLI
jgi:hypothetical protein